MRIAIPLADGKLALHFGHCEQFALIDADPETGKILSRENVTPPPHEPGLLPRWLGEKAVNVILAGGMGQRALMLFDAQGIEVVTGAPADEPETLVAAFLAQSLETGQNACDH